MTTPPLTIGTAGHVDHGKTALVRALTGKDTDRLAEEHERGISIELGFAPLDLPDGRRLSLIDVPGHERFVRTMVAGASGIDMYLMCVAADDGVMPQTREHAAVLRHLGVDTGVVALTKADVAETDGAKAEVAKLMPGAPIVATSAPRGQGLSELLAAVERVAGELPTRAEAAGPMCLHADRSFTLRGIGTVVTGTLWAESIGVGDVVEILPAHRRARVRSLQVHDEPRQRAQAGQRVAVALTGVDRDEVGRGDVLCAPGSSLAETYLVDAAVTLDGASGPLEPGTRIQVHHGTREAPARLVPLAGDRLAPGVRGYAQLRLESPLVCAQGDRLVLRRLAPPGTVGGAIALDVKTRKHGPSAELVGRLQQIERGEAPPVKAASTPPACPATSLSPDLGDLPARIMGVLDADGREPRPDARLAQVLDISTGQLDAGLRVLTDARRAVRVGPAQHIAAGALAEMSEAVAALCRRQGHATIASVRDDLATSRKYAQAVLEHLDRTRVTRREGDSHVLRRP